MWLQLAGEPGVFKLIRTDLQDKRIQGLLHVGALDPTGAFVMDSLLEASPFNRSGASQPEYYGVGSVLAARLAAESILLGGQGRVVVQPRTGTAPFYKRIGFRVFSPASQRYILSVEQAALLMQKVLIEQV